MLTFEQRLWARGNKQLAGVDEAGRGPLAGPVVAAAVVFRKTFLEQEASSLFKSLTDSKRLTEINRNYFFHLLIESANIEIGIGFGDVSEIDTINILRSTHKAMARALQNLPFLPDHALIDGLPVPDLPCPSTAIIKGDSRSLSIAAASVIAKVTRDQWMKFLDRKYPEYGFKQHKGYCTTGHIHALLKYGSINQHRHSFRPVRDIDEIRCNSKKSDFKKTKKSSKTA